MSQWFWCRWSPLPAPVWQQQSTQRIGRAIVPRRAERRHRRRPQRGTTWALLQVPCAVKLNGVHISQDGLQLSTESDGIYGMRIWTSVLVVNQTLQSCIRLSPHGTMLSGFQFPACDDPATFVHTLSKCTWFSRLAHWPWKNAIPCNSLSESEITCTSGSAMASPMGRLKCLRLSSGCQSPSSCCDSATTITVVAAAVFPLGSHGMSPNDLVMARPWRFNQCSKHHVLVCKPNRLNLAKPHLGSGLQPFTLVVQVDVFGKFAKCINI